MAFKKGGPAALLLLATVLAPVEAFHTVISGVSRGRNRLMVAAPSQNSRSDGPLSDRRGLLQQVAASGLALGLLSTPPKPAGAEVYFDPDRYGDKELKIATVNKLRQKLRNSLGENLQLGVPYLRLAINDALGYEAASDDGGLDGSVLYELEQPQNANLGAAAKAVLQIKRELQATNEMTLADIIAFAGSLTIEAFGGPRISVQIGRYDAKGPNGNTATEGYGWGDNLTGSGLKAAFTKSGLGAREAVLLYGALGCVALAAKPEESTGGDEDADFDEEQPFIPTSFGRSQDIYGGQVGTGGFNNRYLKALIKGGKPGASVGLASVDKALLEDSQLKAFVQKYGDNENAFIKDVAEAYQKIVLLGQKGTTRNS